MNEQENKIDILNNKYGITGQHDSEQLKILQSLPLKNKIQISQTRLIEYYKKNNGRCSVSFSGGKDSTVLAYLSAQVCQLLGYRLTLWFSDTGLEYPELREHVKNYSEWLKVRFPDIEIELFTDYPEIWEMDEKIGKRKWRRISFNEIIHNYGYPIISKETSGVIDKSRNAIQKGNEDSCAIKQLNNEKRYENQKFIYDHKKYKFLLDAPFEISNMCCEIMKKRPAHRFTREMGLKPIIGTMASESRLRRSQWLREGCNSYSKKNPYSKPISFWTEQDVFQFVLDNDIPIPSIYGEIKQDEKGKHYTTGVNRTGCCFCLYGIHLEKSSNRMELLSESHPNIYDFCMRGTWTGYNEVSDGLGYWFIFEYLRKYGNIDIKTPDIEYYIEKYSNEYTDSFFKRQ